MVKHAWTILCSRVLNDRETNVLSVDVVEEIAIGIVEPIDLDAVKTIPFTLHIVTLWYQTDGTVTSRVPFRLRSIDPLGVQVGIFEGLIELNQPRVRATIQLVGIGVRGPGNYEFVLEADTGGWVEHARVPLLVHLNPPIVQARPS